MSGADHLSRIAPYLGRLLEDEYIQEQIGEAFTGLWQSSRRAKGRKASEAIKDRRLRNQLLDAAGSLTEAVRSLKQPPPPKRHPVKRALLLAAVAGAVTLCWQKRSPRTALNPTNRGEPDG